MVTPNNIWTREEVDLLVTKYPYMSAKHIQSELPRHTIYSIYRKAQELGLRAYKRKQDYSAYLYANAGKAQISELCNAMACCRSTVYRRIRALGISTLNPLAL
jgi:transcriptional regulator of acetoin/glycerol metabolism